MFIYLLTNLLTIPSSTSVLPSGFSFLFLDVDPFGGSSVRTCECEARFLSLKVSAVVCSGCQHDVTGQEPCWKSACPECPRATLRGIPLS